MTHVFTADSCLHTIMEPMATISKQLIQLLESASETYQIRYQPEIRFCITMNAAQPQTPH
jgi:hypothetical protein